MQNALEPFRAAPVYGHIAHLLVMIMNKPVADKNSSKRLSGGFPPADVVQDGIALRLRQLYSNLENEGIPDNLLHLLEKLDEAERAQSRGASTDQQPGA
jgi:hypothetical protein